MEGLDLSTVGSPIIVIGMHRSGTSLVSRILHKMQVHMGADTSRTDESKSFRELNRQLMRGSSARWHDPTPMWEVLSCPSEIYRLSIRLESACQSGDLREYCGGSWLRDSLWGWKDPRSTVTLPVWLKLFPDARVIHVVRNGIDVAVSLLRRSRTKKRRTWKTRLRLTADQVLPRQQPTPAVLPFSQRHFRDLDDAFALWRCYLSFAEYGVQNLPPERLHTLRFEDLAERTECELDRLGRFIQRPQASSKLCKIAQVVNSNRAWSFTDSEELTDFAHAKTGDPAMERYGYAHNVGVQTTLTPETGKAS